MIQRSIFFHSMRIWTALVATSIFVAFSLGEPISVSSGLHNLGNTCYLSAQLQCAYHIPLVRNLVLREPKDNRNDDPKANYQSSKALKALRQLFAEMQQSNSPIAPRNFCMQLGIPLFEQQDSQEFWKLLLPALSLPPLTDLYQGAYEDYIVALDGSGRERRREEAFLDLSLDVPSASLEASLNAMFGVPELLSEKEGNGWRPEKGADKVDAHKGSLLKAQGLPSILQFHLKRFNMDWNTETVRKLNDPFTFPFSLDLSNLCRDTSDTERNTVIYDLQAVVIHQGEYGAGHYYVYLRPDARSDEWVRFNDHLVDRDLDFDQIITDAYGFSRKDERCSKSKTFLSRLRRMFGSDTSDYGYGGPTANAYVLQYIRRCDIPRLYD